MRAPLHRRLHDERGVAAVVVAVSLMALFGAAILTLDAGSLWATRRNVITGTDAAALDAAYYFNTVGSPCDPGAITSAENSATNVLTTNNPEAIHNPAATPNGFEVTTAVPCGTASYIPGKVRYDALLTADQSFSGLFNVSDPKAFSSSTAAWGYITAIGQGLRPIAICDQSRATFANPLPPGPGVAPYPHYYLWREYWFGRIDQTTYDSYWGSDHDLTLDPPISPEYPRASEDFENGMSSQNPNRGRSYIAPDGANGFHTDRPCDVGWRVPIPLVRTQGAGIAGSGP